MNVDAEATQEASAVRPWWREWEVGLLIVLIVVGYFLRTGAVPIRGEEPRWAEVAREFVQNGAWIVPREQGEVYLDRPPLHSWLLVIAHQVTGSWDRWTLRMPSLIATLLTTLLIYGYGRTFLTRLGALAAALAFATMGEMFQTGQLGETDALFITLVSASFLVWHWGWTRGWRPALTWSAGYGLMALATLTKGLQAPVYFVAAIVLYLVLTGAWRELFRPAHWCGIAVGGLVLAAWLVPLTVELGPDGVVTAYEKLSSYRLRWNSNAFGKHLLIFPFEVFGCMMPWSLFLLLFAQRGFRGTLANIRPQVLFLTLGPLVAFPTCWLHPGGNTRYFAPLYPLLALLMGLAAERCAGAAATSPWRRAWGSFATITVLAMLAIAGFVAAQGAGVFRLSALAHLAPAATAAYTLIFGACAATTWLASRGEGARHAQSALLAIASFMVAACAGLLTDIRVRRAEDSMTAMAELWTRIPADQTLVSFNHVAPLFRYYYGDLISSRPFPKDASDPFSGYFCYHWDHTEPPKLPFAWEQVGVFSLDRVRREQPMHYVVIGRRVADAAQISAVPTSR